MFAKITWITSLLKELHILSELSVVYSDNLKTILLTANPVSHSKSKHFELNLHFISDQVKTKLVYLVHLPRRYQVTNIFIKPLSRTSFHTFQR